MAINSVGGAGGVVFSNVNASNMPLQVLTQLVMAEAMMTREAEQQQKVEEIAAQNAKAKEYNDALAELARLAEGFKADAGNADKREMVMTDHKAIGKDQLDQWKAIVQGGDIKVKNADGKYETVKTAGLTFEQRLDLLSETSQPSLTDAQKEQLRGRARLADMAQSYGMLIGGNFDRGDSLANVAYGDPTKGTLESLKTKIRTAAEAISTNNQLEMIKLQQLIGAVDAAKTALTQFVKTAGDAEKEIVQKF